MTQQYIYNTLLSEFPYFKRLDVKKRELLCARTEKFIELTKFVGKQDLVVTDKMKVLIAACSQQLTLSFKDNYLYNHFERILVYPEKYFSPFSKTQNVGEMNTAGLLIFSWADFYDGIKIDDNKNVGLHEFAHALEFIDIAQKDTDERFSYALDKEFMVAYDYIKNRPQEHFFRSYAATNRAEFFAVATEYFFESPLDFSRAHPDIFALFCKIYGQDPRPSQISFKPYSSMPLKELGETLYNPFVNVQWNSVISLITFLMAFVMLFVIGNEGITPFGIFALSICSVVSVSLSVFFTSFSLYENGIRIHRGLWFKLIALFYPGIKENISSTIRYEDVFSMNVTGDLEEEQMMMLLRSNNRSVPSLKVHYYENGKIKSSTLSLGTVSRAMDLLEKLYLHKKVCVRIDGQIKRFEL